MNSTVQVRPKYLNADNPNRNSSYDKYPDMESCDLLVLENNVPDYQYQYTH